MSVLIKGMTMPKNCGECPMICEDDLCHITKGGRTINERPPHCPLIEVPPHGRLIDADKLKEEFPHDEDWDYPINTNSYVVETIDKSPTIIEAEENEDG